MAVRRPCARVGRLVTRDFLVAKVFLPSSCSEGISSLLCIPSLAVCSISVGSSSPECFSAQLAPPDRFGRASRGLLGTPGPAGYCFVGLRHLGIWVCRVSHGHHVRVSHITHTPAARSVLVLRFLTAASCRHRKCPRTLSGSRRQLAKRHVSRLRPVTLTVTVSGEVRGF